jgi:N6-adenosine-specific RNA methylase IME4
MKRGPDNRRPTTAVDEFENDEAFLGRLRRIELTKAMGSRAQIGLFGDAMPTQAKRVNRGAGRTRPPRRAKTKVVPIPLAQSPTHASVHELLQFAGTRRFGTILADPPWQFQNKTGKVAPEHKRLNRYATMTLDEITQLPVGQITADVSHLYLWVPNALLPDGLAVLSAWGFTYKGNIVWEKVRKDGGPDGRGVGFYFRNVTELILFGVKGKNARTRAAGRRQVNFIATRKREHSRKPDEQYPIIEACSHGPFLELFARGARKGWAVWGNQADDGYAPTWKTYANHSQVKLAAE